MGMRYFGTDGIRGQVGTGPITPQFFTKIAWALGQIFRNEEAHARVIIGKDTRISGYMLESAMQAGFAAAGADTMLVGPMPTPAIAYLTRTFRADVGVVISASHNGYMDNGVKFFSRDGMKLGDDLEQKIEEYLDKDMDTVSAVDLGRAARVVDARGRYIEFCKSTLRYNSDITGKKLLIDCAHGATYSVADKVFSELGADVEVINDKPDGININHNCGSTHAKCISSETVKHQADIGIAFDGDGDRVIMCDHRGEIVDGDVLLYILTKYMKELGTLESDKVIGTVATNYGLELSLKRLGVKLKRVPVGDRHIIDEMAKGTSNLGGESSGHMICDRYTTTGDGIIVALQVLAALNHFDCDFEPLVKEAALIPSSHDHIKCKDPKTLIQYPELKKKISELELKIKSKGRLLVRPSGTEPILRISVESADKALRLSTITAIKNVAEKVDI